MSVQTVGNIGTRLDLLVRQGSTYELDIRLQNPDTTPINLTGKSFLASITKDPLDERSLTIPFAVTIVDALDGKLKISMPPGCTRLLEAGLSYTDPDSKYYWLLDLVDDTEKVYPMLYGDVQVFRGGPPPNSGDCHDI